LAVGQLVVPSGRKGAGKWLAAERFAIRNPALMADKMTRVMAMWFSKP
jgi:hypothetical protein